MNFETLGLDKELIKAIKNLGFETPMPIQEKAIPELLSGERDFVGLAQTGTGKTGAFGLPLIQLIDTSLNYPQGVIVCPTRELCLQIADDLKQFGKYVKSLNIVEVYGGASISTQARQIKNGSQIIVATPGRLLDLMERKAINLSRVSYAVLDEADEMLNMGFKEDIDRILDSMPEHRRIWLFSATMPKGVAAIARNYLKNPLEVSMGQKNRTAENIEHTCYVIQEKNRYQGLKRIIDYTPEMFGLVFCRTRKETQTVAETLLQDGYQAEALHGDLSQGQRDHVMRKFRQGTIQILVATDVAARGLDVDDITHVIHYRLPDEAEIYTHRSGRTARAGKSGTSISLINIKEKGRVNRLEKMGSIKIQFGRIPNGRDICKKQLLNMIDKIMRTDVNQDEMADYLPAIYDSLEGIDKEELITRFVSTEFNRFLKYYRDAGDINVKSSREASAVHRPAKQRESFKGKKTQRFFISVGKLDKITKGEIVRLICENTGIRADLIGEIDLNREFSFFEVEKSASRKIRKSFTKTRLNGRPVQVHRVLKKEAFSTKKELRA
jgi:ATP-dependent RNA helicase DeaD